LVKEFLSGFINVSVDLSLFSDNLSNSPEFCVFRL
jgi:hypothetical protein